MNKLTKLQLHDYSVEELAERSADLELLIDKLVDLTNIPHNMRTISTNAVKIKKLTAEIYEIIRVNRKINQLNIIQQNLFDL